MGWRRQRLEGTRGWIAIRSSGCLVKRRKEKKLGVYHDA